MKKSLVSYLFLLLMPLFQMQTCEELEEYDECADYDYSDCISEKPIEGDFL